MAIDGFLFHLIAEMMMNTEVLVLLRFLKVFAACVHFPLKQSFDRVYESNIGLILVVILYYHPLLHGLY